MSCGMYLWIFLHKKELERRKNAKLVKKSALADK
jgi:hypothetical protein